MIAHRLSTIVDADTIYVLNRGEMAESGSHRALLAEKGRYYQMYQLQQVGESLNAPKRTIPLHYNCEIVHINRCIVL